MRTSKSTCRLIIALFLGAFVLTPSWHVAFATGIHQHDGGAPHDHGDSSPDHGKGSSAHFSLLTTPQSVVAVEAGAIALVFVGFLAVAYSSLARFVALIAHPLRGPPSPV